MSIRVEELVKIYGVQRAVDSISFEIRQGEITGFLGPNGAGKSTTMKIATGYLTSTSGEVWMDEIPVGKNPIEVKRITGYLPEHNPMYLDMYVREFLGFIGQAFDMGRNLKSRIDEVIELCGLTAEKHKRLHALSKGYRQRVGLAKALLPDPKILVLDEPTTGLDPNQILEIRQVIREISKDKTVILSTHIMQEVEALCDKVVIINQGKIVADTTVGALKESSQGYKLEVTFDADIDVTLFDALSQKGKLSVVSQRVLQFESENNLRNEILKIATANDLPLKSLQDIEGTLEEVFHQLTNRRVEE